jgi:hypothetical protein
MEESCGVKIKKVFTDVWKQGHPFATCACAHSVDQCDGLGYCLLMSEN